MLSSNPSWQPRVRSLRILLVCEGVCCPGCRTTDKSKPCQLLARVEFSTTELNSLSQVPRDAGAEEAPPHGLARTQLDAEPRASSVEDTLPPLGTPNLAFNKLATMLTHLISRVRQLQAEVNTLASPSHGLYGPLLSIRTAILSFAPQGSHAESVQCLVRRSIRRLHGPRHLGSRCKSSACPSYHVS
jgi:hypothetical protein